MKASSKCCKKKQTLKLFCGKKQKETQNKKHNFRPSSRLWILSDPASLWCIPLPLLLDSPCLAEVLLLFSVSECFMKTNRFILTVVTCYWHRANSQKNQENFPDGLMSLYVQTCRCPREDTIHTPTFSKCQRSLPENLDPSRVSR